MRLDNQVEKIRILRIIARMNIGGPAVQVTTLSRGFSDSLFEELLVTGNCEEGEQDYLELNGIDLPHIRIPGLGRSIDILDDIRAFKHIKKIIHDFQPQIVHTHTFKAGLLGRLASLLSRQKHFRIHTFHGHLLFGYLSNVKLRILIAVERYLAKRSDKLVSVGESVAKDLIAQKIGSWDKFVVIPPGFPIPEQIQSNSQIRPKQLRSDAFICAWIGRLVEVKSPDRIIEIAKEVKLRGLNIRFIVIGDGPLRSRTEEDSIAENLPITFLGWQKDVVKLLLGADALILTSLNEGTPISIVEAQRLGRPVVATNVGSVSEVIINGKSGFAIEFHTKDFVDRLELLSNNAIIYEQFSDAARAFAETRFSEDRLVADHKNLYLDLTY